MRVRFLVDPADLRRWQAEAIVAVLSIEGVSCDVAPVSGRGRQRLLDLCLAFEALGSRHGRCRLLDPIRIVDLGLPPATGATDLVVDLAASEGEGDRLMISVAGADVVTGAAAALAAGTEPVLDLLAVASGKTRLAGCWRLGVENPRRLAPGLASACGRAIEMVHLAVSRIAAGTRPADLDLSRAETSGPPLATGSLAGFALRSLTARLAGRLDRLVRTPANWAVGWRPDRTGDGALPEIAGHPWQRLADDGRRFYADPFVWRHDGRSVLFVEEFPYATGRGIISAVDLGAEGPLGTPRPVIETDCHLSYPFVFEEGGAVYMIPETSGRRSVELWRAVVFPDRWELSAKLIEDLDVSDITLHRSSGRYFLFGSVRPEGCSSWDGLSVFVADRLAGPYEMMGDGPQKVDVASARPAGRLFEAGGALIRPFQDSRGGYGAGLGFARVDRLNDGRLAETVLVTARPRRPLSGLHTYNREAGFEVIDVISPSGLDLFLP